MQSIEEVDTDASTLSVYIQSAHRQNKAKVVTVCHTVKQSTYEKASAVVHAITVQDKQIVKGKAMSCLLPSRNKQARNEWCSQPEWDPTNKKQDPRVIVYQRQGGIADMTNKCVVDQLLYRSSLEYAACRFSNALCTNGSLAMTCDQAESLPQDTGELSRVEHSATFQTTKHKLTTEPTAVVFEDTRKTILSTNPIVHAVEHFAKAMSDLQEAGVVEQISWVHGARQDLACVCQLICTKLKACKRALTDESPEAVTVGVLLPYTRSACKQTVDTLLAMVKARTGIQTKLLARRVLFGYCDYFVVRDNHRGYPRPIRASEFNSCTTALRDFIADLHNTQSTTVHVIMAACQVHSLVASLDILEVLGTWVKQCHHTLSIVVDPIDTVRAGHPGSPFASMVLDNRYAAIGVFTPWTDPMSNCLRRIQLVGNAHDLVRMPESPIKLYTNELAMCRAVPDVYTEMLNTVHKCTLKTGWRNCRVFKQDPLDHRVSGMATWKTEYAFTKGKQSPTSLKSMAIPMSSARHCGVVSGDRCLFATDAVSLGELYAVLSRMNAKDTLHVIGELKHTAAKTWTEMGYCHVAR